MDEFQKAEEYYDKYLSQVPETSPDEILRFTEILGKNNKIKKGEKILKEYTDKYPDDWRLHSLYSEMVSQLDPHKALAMRQQLLETNPNTENNLMLGNMASRLALDNSDESEKIGPYFSNESK